MPGKSTVHNTPEVLVVLVVDGTYRLADHFHALVDTYLKNIFIELMKPILFENEEKASTERKIPTLKCGLVVFHHYRPFSATPVESRYFSQDSLKFLEQLKELEFKHGGMSKNAVAEGLAAALEMFEQYEIRKGDGVGGGGGSVSNGSASSSTPLFEPKRHCILISNSEPLADPVHFNFDEKYDNFTIGQICEEMANQNIFLSLIAPEGDKPELEDIVKKVNIHTQVETAESGDTPHILMLAGGIKLPEPKAHEGSNIFKREESGDIHHTGQPVTKKQKVDHGSNEIKLEKNEQQQTNNPSQAPTPTSSSIMRQSPASSPNLQQGNSNTRAKKTPLITNQKLQSPSARSSPVAHQSPQTVLVQSPVAMTPPPPTTHTSPVPAVMQTTPILTTTVPPQAAAAAAAAATANPIVSPAMPAQSIPISVPMNAIAQTLQVPQAITTLSSSNLFPMPQQIIAGTQQPTAIQSPGMPQVIRNMHPNPQTTKISMNNWTPELRQQQQHRQQLLQKNNLLKQQYAQSQQNVMKKVNAAIPAATAQNPTSVLSFPGQLPTNATGAQAQAAAAAAGMQNIHLIMNAFAPDLKNKAPPDYNVASWPEKMEIQAVLPLKDLQRDFNNRPLVSFTITSQPGTENASSFQMLLANLSKRELAACARFPNSATSSGGILLFNNSDDYKNSID
ncbi:7862_t:CDS:2 [Ambispora leptoticha]|uniref:Mediator of RNA polymerase II transcription subunit 25 n=1 Tax=Ambispora leptoticha TaxID=144679 RepID=A0A9N9AAV1_9GLOM|nr:7862_t:CDS:2 [Ambispora leptoticha]